MNTVSTTTARLALRADAYHAQSPTGAVILTHQGTVSLTGASIHQWIDRLAPFLDGRYSLPELTAALPPERRQLVEQIVTTLLERGVVREIRADEPHGLSPSDTAAYRAELDFLGYFRDSAGRAFERYRDSPVLVLGSGWLLPVVVRAGLRSGLRLVRAVVTPERPTDPALPQSCAQRDEGQLLEWHSQRVDTEEEVAVLLDGAELVVHVCDHSVVARAGLLERLCGQRGVPLVEAIVTGEAVWVGPAGRVGVDGPGASDGWRCLVALEGAHSSPPGEVATTVAGAAATVVAGQLVQDLFRYATEVAAPSPRPRLTRIQPGTLRGETHHFLAHPFSLAATAASEAEFLDRISELDARAPLDAEEFSRHAAACTDARLGVFGEVTEDNFAQLPVHVAQTRVSDPVSLLGTDAPRPVVTGAGVDFATARYQAALGALATYASLMVDPRRLLTGDGQAPLPLAGDLPAALARLRSGELAGWVRALSLTDGRPRLLAADKVFPALRQPRAPYRSPLGVAAAYSWPEVVTAGLIQHCRQLTIAETTASTGLFPLVDLDSVPADKVLGWCLTMVAALGEPVTVHEVTGSLGVPTFACSLGGRTVAYGCGVSSTDALREGLLRLLLAYQARANDEPAYAPAAVPGFASPLRSEAARPVVSRPPLELPALVAALARRGYHAAVVPLDHDQEVCRIMPYLAHVVVQA